MNLRRTDLILGLFFFAALIGLGTVTIVLSDFALGVQSWSIQMHSADVGYLRPGDPVLLHGMASGKVTAIERLPRPRILNTRHPNPEQPDIEHETTVLITAKLDVDPFEHLKPDFRILIEDRGFLGGKLVRIEAGMEPGDVDPELPLVAVNAVSVLQSAGEVVEENREAVRNALANFERISQQVADGEGTLGRLIMEGGIADSAEETLGSIGDVFSGLRDGEGTIGKLFTDDQLHDDIGAMASNIREITDDVAAGEGTMGKLFSDGTLHDDAAAFMADMREIGEDITAGEGTVGKLIQSSELHDNINATVDEIRAVASGAQEGDGLLAALLHDEEIADNFRSILAQVRGAIEDARETTPVQSVGSFLFGTF